MCARKDIFAILEEKYTPVEEFIAIHKLFNEPCLYVVNRHAPCNPEAVADMYFHKWKARGFCTSCADMRSKLDIHNNLRKPSNISTDEILTYLEYYCNIIYHIITNIEEFNYRHTPEFSLLLKNIIKLLDKLNYKMIKDEQEQKTLLIPKNPEASAVAELSTEDTAMAIFKYHHGLLKGNLEEKSRLLAAIAKEYEELLKAPPNGFKDYFVQTKGLLNNLDIRHNNKASISGMSPDELEEWYDDLYQMLLFCVLIKDNMKRKEKASEFLKSLKNDTT